MACPARRRRRRRRWGGGGHDRARGLAAAANSRHWDSPADSERIRLPRPARLQVAEKDTLLCRQLKRSTLISTLANLPAALAVAWLVAWPDAPRRYQRSDLLKAPSVAPAPHRCPAVCRLRPPRRRGRQRGSPSCCVARRQRRTRWRSAGAVVPACQCCHPGQLGAGNQRHSGAGGDGLTPPPP